MSISKKALEIALLITANTSAASRAVANFANNSRKKMESINKNAEKLVSSGAKNVATGLAIASPIGLALKVASDFQDKMIDIRKQMQIDTPKSVEVMTKSVMDSAKKIPLAMGDIQDLFSGGLRMGIAEKDIAGFAQAAAKMSVAFDISAGTISEDMAGIGKAFKIPIANLGALGDAVNYLDDNSLAKGADIIDVMKRTAGAAKYLSATQSAALSSTLLSLQEVPERAGTAINSMVNTLSAASVQSKKSQKMMSALGFNPKKLQEQMVKDGQGTIIKVLDRINKMPVAKQQSAIFRIFGKEFTPTINKLTNNMGEYRKELAMLNGAQKGSMDKEYQKRIRSASSQMQLLKNRVTALGVSLGNALLPQLTSLLIKIQPVVDKIMNWVQNNPKLVQGLLKGALAIAAVNVSVGAFKIGLGGTGKALAGLWTPIQTTMDLFDKTSDTYNNVSKILTVGKSVILGFGSVFMKVGSFMLTNPIGITITAIGVAVFLLIKYWKPISAFFVKLWSTVTSIFKTVVKVFIALFLNFTPAGLIFKHWGKISGWFISLWSGVKSTFTTVLDFITKLFLNFTPAGLIIKHWSGISKWFSGLWDGVKNLFNKFLDWISNTWVGKAIKIVASIPNAIKNAFSFASNHSLNDVVNKTQSFANNRGATTFLNAPPRLVPKLNPAHSTTTYAPVIHVSGGATAADAQLVARSVKKTLKEHAEQQSRTRFDR